MKRYSRRREATPGGAAFFGMLLLLGLIVKFFWWLVAAAAVVGLFFAARAVVAKVRARRAAAAREAEELAYRADRQNQWARRGDSRGIYGVDGAELMRSISPEPPMEFGAEDADINVAAVADTPGGLTQLLAEKPPGWRWAAFASVLVQRRAAVQSRVRDCRLGYSTSSGIRAYSGFEVGRFVTDCMGEMVQLVGQVDAFMRTPAFSEVFGSRTEESTADADGIVQVANRLMDYHGRFLGLAERCRDVTVPSQYTELMRDVRELMNLPLDSYRTFIDDFVERIAEMPQLMRHGRGTVEADPVVLHMSVDDRLVKGISKQLRAAAKS